MMVTDMIILTTDIIVIITIVIIVLRKIILFDKTPSPKRVNSRNQFDINSPLVPVMLQKKRKGKESKRKAKLRTEK